ncbi:3-deoxy-D-manno-octulosonic acid transferase [Oceanospirillum multiglobuliferum]|uniref:3-deoxy-D-manno-octulosonic acid transferase n=1 Tax=Oceanospirillum multiglobuliferum TaxID=64969 RepID=A0A1V4T5B0_9GAMM|nr:3-deoxy-D-manno-octulosonic acid transferase [Oceanospirillum multiglobuliferum]
MTRGIYNALITLLSPVLLWKVSKETTELNNFSERLGYTPSLPIKPVIWLHAASVGEVIAATPLITRLQKEFEDHLLVVTTVTATGARQARKALKGKGVQLMLPLDLPWVAARFLDRLKPKVAIFMETELWPNFIYGCQEREIPFVIANGRLSDKSLQSYRKLQSVLETALAGISAVAAKSLKDAQGFIDLGVPSDRVKVTGSIKFDVAPERGLLESAKIVRAEQFGERPVWVAGSTHNGEDEKIIFAHKKVLEQYPNAVLIIVPRHPQRFDAVAHLVESAELPFVRRSSNQVLSEQDSVYLVDSMGELMLMYACADIAFVGGSMMPIGGHNLLEPACLGKPVLSGIHLFNFADVAEMFDQEQALIRCDNADALADELIGLWQDPAQITDLGQRALQVVSNNRGALEKQFQLIKNSMQKQVVNEPAN